MIEQLELVKKQILDDGYFQEVKISSKDVRVIDLKHIQVRENIIEVDKSMMTKLLNAMGMSKLLVQNLHKQFGDDDKLLNFLIKKFKTAQNGGKSLTFIWNMNSRRLVNIVATDKIMLNHKTYFDILENKILSKPNMKIDRIALDANTGGVVAKMFSSNDFDVLGLKDEYFKGGYTFDYNLTELRSNYFMMRQVCKNGAIGMKEIATLSANKPEDVGQIILDVRSNAWSNLNIDSFKHDVIKNMHTKASLAEAEFLDKKVRGILTPDQYTEIQKTLTNNRLQDVLPQSAYENKDSMPSIYTDKTRYDLFNELTAVSSYFEKHLGGNFSERANRKLQMQATAFLESKSDLPQSSVKQYFNN